MPEYVDEDLFRRSVPNWIRPCTQAIYGLLCCIERFNYAVESDSPPKQVFVAFKHVTGQYGELFWTYPFGEFFCGGYFELCKAAQLVVAPSIWHQREYAVMDCWPPSWHMSASCFLDEHMLQLASILYGEAAVSYPDPEKWGNDEGKIADLYQRTMESKGRLKKWASLITDARRASVPILYIEQTQTLKVAKDHPLPDLGCWDNIAPDGSEVEAPVSAGVSANSFPLLCSASVPPDVERMAQLLAENPKMSKRQAAKKAAKGKGNEGSVYQRFHRLQMRGHIHIPYSPAETSANTKALTTGK